MDDLKFLSFQKVQTFQSVNGLDGETIYDFTNNSDDRENLLQQDEHIDQVGNLNFWSFEYYQQFFDVNTDQVLSRLLNSMMPRPKRNFIEEYIRPLPDFYGPFWICVTLIFTTGICGNLTTWIQSAGRSTNAHFQTDFHLVTGAATLILLYVMVLPFTLYSLLWYRRSPVQYTFLELLSTYGYSLTVFVPVSFSRSADSVHFPVLWLIQVDIIRWILLVTAVFLSGSVIAFSFWPAVCREQKTIAYSIIAFILISHSVLAFGFKEFYFDTALLNAKMTGNLTANFLPEGAISTVLYENELNSDVKSETFNNKGSKTNKIASDNFKQDVGEKPGEIGDVRNWAKKRPLYIRDTKQK